ncbi:hypothetical protein BJ741DRAFT_666906 [Chytriomyces cf. hyalinus JEL632]|nr:hypothetical protein BJ741DRAFT_666906 [Chytriomyces cf. hyalinus JEL632]
MKIQEYSFAEGVWRYRTGDRTSLQKKSLTYKNLKFPTALSFFAVSPHISPEVRRLVEPIIEQDLLLKELTAQVLMSLTLFRFRKYPPDSDALDEHVQVRQHNSERSDASSAEEHLIHPQVHKTPQRNHPATPPLQTPPNSEAQPPQTNDLNEADDAPAGTTERPNGTS